MGKKKHDIAYVWSTLNNTIIIVTDLKKNRKSWSSSSSLGFKGFRHLTNFALQATSTPYGILGVKVWVSYFHTKKGQVVLYPKCTRFRK